MENKNGLILSFVIGAAVGAMVGYLMASGKSDEIMEDFKEAADKMKSEFDRTVESGKDFLNNLKNQAESKA
jgi:predicted acylesterase/phospholipase RssA